MVFINTLYFTNKSIFLSFVCFRIMHESSSLVQSPMPTLRNQFVREIFQANESIALNRDLLRALINNCLNATTLEEMFTFIDLLMLVIKRNEFAGIMIFDMDYLDKVFEILMVLQRNQPYGNSADSVFIAMYEQVFVYTLRLIEFLLESRMQKAYFVTALGPMVTQQLIDSFEKAMVYLLKHKDRLKFLEPFFIGSVNPAKAKDLEESLDVVLKIFRQAVELSSKNFILSDFFTRISKMIGYLNIKKGVVNLAELPDKVEDLQKITSHPMTVSFQIYLEEDYPTGENVSIKGPTSISYHEFMSLLNEKLHSGDYELFYMPPNQEPVPIQDGRSFQKMMLETVYSANSLEFNLSIKMIIKPIVLRKFISRGAVLGVRKALSDPIQYAQPHDAV